MSATALLLGGPKDGELIALRDNGDIAVMEFDDPNPLDFFHDHSPVAEVNTKTRYYLGGRVAMFRHVLAVYTYETLTDEERDERAFAHLTSDKAKAAVVR